MPKRPLSAYNLFFKDEREKLVSAGPQGRKVAAKAAKGEVEKIEDLGRKHKKSSGIGFANLAKTIAAKWNDMSPEERKPYEDLAAGEKRKYDGAVAQWRIEQAKKKKAEQKESPKQQQHITSPSMRDPISSATLSPGGFSDVSNPYPPEWFDSSEHTPEMSERTEATAGMSESGVDPAFSHPDFAHAQTMPFAPQLQHYHYMQHPALQHPQQHMQPLMQPSLSSSDNLLGNLVPGFSQLEERVGESRSIFDSVRRAGDMRMPRAASLPVPRQQLASHQLTPYEEFLRQQFAAPSEGAAPIGGSERGQMTAFPSPEAGPYPRSASMPHMSQTQPMYHGGDLMGGYQAETAFEDEEPTMDDSYLQSEVGYVRPLPNSSQPDSAMPEDEQPRQPDQEGQPDQDQPLQESAQEQQPQEDIFETSLHSLSENLDDDAIDFLTTMKYT
jgi:hypothetical protein